MMVFFCLIAGEGLMADTRRELILARMKSNLDSASGATVYRSE